MRSYYGASGGIGKEFAFVFARHGFDLVLVARNRSALEDVKTEIEKQCKVTVVILAKDLSPDNAAEEIHAELNEKNIFPEVVINNAGFGDKCAFVCSDWARQENMIRLNILSLMKMTYVFGGDMKARGYGRF